MGGRLAGRATLTSFSNRCCSLRRSRSSIFSFILVFVSMAPDLIEVIKASRASRPSASDSVSAARSGQVRHFQNLLNKTPGFFFYCFRAKQHFPNEKGLYMVLQVANTIFTNCSHPKLLQEALSDILKYFAWALLSCLFKPFPRQLIKYFNCIDEIIG